MAEERIFAQDPKLRGGVHLFKEQRELKRGSGVSNAEYELGWEGRSRG